MSSNRRTGPAGRLPQGGDGAKEELSLRSSTDSSSGSDSDDTTSSSASTASTSSSSSSATTPPRRAAENTARSKAGPSPSQQQQQQQQRYVHLNAELRFERPDNEYIPLPPLRDMQQISTVLRRISVDKQRYPEGRHRILDYFRVAVEMFVTEVRVEYKQQYLTAQRNGKTMQRFTWKNNGELAICYACCCDMLKLLYDCLQPGPLKPLWEPFVAQLAPLLIIESRVPSTILTEQTYHVKYMDWQKGGTRYAGESQASNVRFPSASDRRLKIETYLKSGAGVKLEVQAGGATAAAAAPAARAAVQPPPAVPSARPDAARPPFAGRLPGSVSVKVPLPPGGAAAARPPVKVPMKQVAGTHTQAQAQAAAPLASSGVKQMPPEMKHLFWLSVLAHVKGGEARLGYPDERLDALPGLLRLCEMTDETEEMCMLMDILANSTGGVQTVFERLGGLLSLRRFAAHFIQRAEAAPLMQLIEQLARWRVAAWGSTSQQAWQTNMDQRRTADLTWLRTLPLIPEEQRAAWGALLLVMEQRFIFRTARAEEGGGAGQKRPRNDDGGLLGDLRAVLSDAVDMQRWVVPRVNVFSAVRLPVEVRVRPLCSKLESDAVLFLDRKMAYSVQMQKTWKRRIEQVLAARPPGAPEVRVPVFYDPYGLLGTAYPPPSG